MCLTSFSLLTLLTLLSLPSFAQDGSIRGRVIDVNTNEPVIGAVVRYSLSGKFIGGHVTDTAGYYIIPALENGRYGIVVSAPGFKDEAIYNRYISRHSKNLRINIDLISGPVLDDVVIRYKPSSHKTNPFGDLETFSDTTKAVARRR